MKKRIVRTVIAVAWLGSLYLAYGFGGSVRVEKTARMLAEAGIRPTHVLWHVDRRDDSLE